MLDRFCPAAIRILLAIAAATVTWCVSVAAIAQPPAPRAVTNPDQRGLQVGPADQWDTFGVDVSIRQWRIGDGTAPSAADISPAAYRFERSQIRGQWRTVITVRSLPELKARGPQGEMTLPRRHVIARIEDDEDGTPPRMYDARGALIDIPASFPLPFPNRPDAGDFPMPRAGMGPGQSARPVPVQGTEWIDRFVATPAGHQRRKDALIRHYGAPVGQLRGLDRFLRASGTQIEEVLADPQTGVEVEVNRVRDGQLLAHRTIAYEQIADGVLARRIVRTERLVSRESGERAVTEIQFGNISFERRR